MQPSGDATLAQLLHALRVDPAALALKNVGVTVYAFLSVVSELLQVLIDQKVKSPVQVLESLLADRTVAEMRDKFDRTYTVCAISQGLPLYLTFLNQNLPVFGDEYITGQLRASDVARLCQDLTWLMQPAARFTTFCYEGQDSVVTYCLNKDPVMA